jgi:hypothetical protein
MKRWQEFLYHLHPFLLCAIIETDDLSSSTSPERIIWPNNDLFIVAIRNNDAPRTLIKSRNALVTGYPHCACVRYLQVIYSSNVTTLTMLDSSSPARLVIPPLTPPATRGRSARSAGWGGNLTLSSYSGGGGLFTTKDTKDTQRALNLPSWCPSCGLSALRGKIDHTP